jgi:hypothetical protein
MKRPMFSTVRSRLVENDAHKIIVRALHLENAVESQHARRAIAFCPLSAARTTLPFASSLMDTSDGPLTRNGQDWRSSHTRMDSVSRTSPERATVGPALGDRACKRASPDADRQGWTRSQRSRLDEDS